MRLRHALILAINTSILAVLFAFSAWLYASTRREAEAQAAAGLARSGEITEKLAELRERELSSLAQSVAASPMLRGALATGDGETIRDVLRSLAARHGLHAVAVRRAGRVLHRHPADARPLEEGRFVGLASASPDGGGDELAIAQRPSPALLEAWSGITGARYALRGGPDPAPTHDLPAEDAALAAKSPGTALSVLSSGARRWYAAERPLLGGRFSVSIFLPHAPFWESFESRRNSLVVLGAFLFFGGLLLSLAFAPLVERHASAAGSDALVASLVEEIEKARAARSG